MSIQFRRMRPEDTILELGGGSRPQCHPKCLGGQDTHIDVRKVNNAEGKPCVDIEWDLSKYPWPVQKHEFTSAIAMFVFEHIPYPKSRGFLKELMRVVKPGGKVVLIIPNTEAQVKWILEHPNGWDNKDFFTAASEKLFGSQNAGNAAEEVSEGHYHAAYFNQQVAAELLRDAGFERVVISPFGERETDMVVEAHTPTEAAAAVETLPIGPYPAYQGPNQPGLTWEERANLFNRKYFDSYPGSKMGFYWDDPKHEAVARNVLARKPESVLELGCARGYTLKRLGLDRVAGIDISKHAYLTRVCNNIKVADITKSLPWGLWGETTFADKEWDLCFSTSLLDYIPVDLLPVVIQEMDRVSKRGLHAVHFPGQEAPVDPLRCTVRPKEWWTEYVLPAGHEVISVGEMETGELPQEYVHGDGKTKLNVGCAWTQFHHGWTNIDAIDANQFASLFHFNFKRHDILQGLPYGTGVVDAIFSSHMLEHLTYQQGLTFLRECRRVIRPDGYLRIVVPDAAKLVYDCTEGGLDEYNESNGGCADAKTTVAKLWALMVENHKAAYDYETLSSMLKEAQWNCNEVGLNSCSSHPQLLREIVEMDYGFSLFVDATPKRTK